MYQQYRSSNNKMATKVITVFGATGQQGGTVTRAILAGGHFKVRGVTRNPDSEAAKALKKQGVEVVKGDLDDKPTLLAALKGAYGCYGVTDFWAHMDEEREIKQGKALADACKEAKVQHFVFSGLENTTPVTGLRAPHFDGKGKIEEYIKSLKIPFTMVRIAGYFEIFLSELKAQKMGDDKYGVFIPMADKPLWMIPVREMGECVHQVFLQKDQYLGKTVGFATENLTNEEIAKIMSEELGTTVVDGKMTNEAYTALGFPGADYLSNMFMFYQSGKAIRDIELTKKLNPKISTFRPWVKANKEGLLAAMNS